MMERGVGTVMAKFDVESAYRNVPIHLDDRPLLGMPWREELYVGTAPPIRLAICPKYFCGGGRRPAVDLGRSGGRFTPLFGRLYSVRHPECELALKKALEICKRLGVPIAVHKTEGPAVVID